MLPSVLIYSIRIIQNSLEAVHPHVEIIERILRVTGSVLRSRFVDFVLNKDISIFHGTK